MLSQAQAIKNSGSLRWKSLLDLKCRNRLLLTGTPIQNRYVESIENALVFIFYFRPINKIKDQGAIEKIQMYIDKEEQSTRNRISDLFSNMKTENPANSVKVIADKILSSAMPYLNALDKIHHFGRNIGIL